MVLLWNPVWLLVMVMLYSPVGNVSSVIMLQEVPEQLAWNVPLSILCSMLEVLVCGSLQSSLTVPSNAIVLPRV